MTTFMFAGWVAAAAALGAFVALGLDRLLLMRRLRQGGPWLGLYWVARGDIDRLHALLAQFEDELDHTDHGGSKLLNALRVARDSGQGQYVCIWCRAHVTGERPHTCPACHGRTFARIEVHDEGQIAG